MGSALTTGRDAGRLPGGRTVESEGIFSARAKRIRVAPEPALKSTADAEPVGEAPAELTVFPGIPKAIVEPGYALEAGLPERRIGRSPETSSAP